MRYFDGKSFYKNQNKEQTRYEITDEEMQSLCNQVNEYTEGLSEIVSDETGKPVFKIIEVDYVSLYRKRRQKECFSIINRGNAWYNSLTQTQKDELQVWYQQWLDVTETLTEPVKPTWLN